MIGHSVVTLGVRDSSWLLMRSPRQSSLNTVEFFLEDGLEIAIQASQDIELFELLVTCVICLEMIICQ